MKVLTLTHSYSQRLSNTVAGDSSIVVHDHGTSTQITAVGWYRTSASVFWAVVLLVVSSSAATTTTISSSSSRRCVIVVEMV